MSRPDDRAELAALVAARDAFERAPAEAEALRAFQAARNAFCLVHARLTTVALHDTPATVRADLRTDAWLWLIWAAERYDPSRGTFSNLAVRSIRLALRRYGRRLNQRVHVPDHVAGFTCVPVASLDAPITRDSERSFGDSLSSGTASSPIDEIDLADLDREVERLFDSLSDEHQQALRERLGLDCEPLQTNRVSSGTQRAKNRAQFEQSLEAFWRRARWSYKEPRAACILVRLLARSTALESHTRNVLPEWVRDVLAKHRVTIASTFRNDSTERTEDVAVIETPAVPDREVASVDSSRARERAFRRHASEGTPTSLPGVHKSRKGAWIAQIRSAGVKHHLGCFSTPEEAHAAYVRARQEVEKTGTVSPRTSNLTDRHVQAGQQ